MDNLFRIVNCLSCGKKLSGRLDKKFCDSYCRNTYNNSTKREDELYIKNVNQAIRRNRRILKSLCPIGKATVRKEVLDALNFQYKYFSMIYRSKQNQEYYVCYDYAFSPIKEFNRFTHEAVKKALIVQKQEYFDKYTTDPWS